MNGVVVLNSDYTFMGNIDWKRSIVLLYQGKAETIKDSDKTVYNHNKTCSYIIPKVIRLIKYVTQIFKNKIPYSKSNVFIRDNYICQYCGIKMEKKQCTIDHIVPKSKGGISSWENCTTSCKNCNNYKGDYDLKDISLTLKKKPVQPNVSDFNRIKSETLMDTLKNIW